MWILFCDFKCQRCVCKRRAWWRILKRNHYGSKAQSLTNCRTVNGNLQITSRFYRTVKLLIRIFSSSINVPMTEQKIYADFLNSRAQTSHGQKNNEQQNADIRFIDIISIGALGKNEFSVHSFGNDEWNSPSCRARSLSPMSWMLRPLKTPRLRASCPSVAAFLLTAVNRVVPLKFILLLSLSPWDFISIVASSDLCLLSFLVSSSSPELLPHHLFETTDKPSDGNPFLNSSKRVCPFARLPPTAVGRWGLCWLWGKACLEVLVTWFGDPLHWTSHRKEKEQWEYSLRLRSIHLPPWILKANTLPFWDKF